MGKYFGTIDDTVKRDELFGGGDGFPVELVNVKVGVGTEIKRGNILAGNSPTGTFSIATAADTSKNLVIASEDFIAADSDSAVTSAYSSGKFNREKLSADTETTVATLETELRRQNIILTSLKEME